MDFYSEAVRVLKTICAALNGGKLSCVLVRRYKSGKQPGCFRVSICGFAAKKRMYPPIRAEPVGLVQHCINN